MAAIGKEKRAGRRFLRTGRPSLAALSLLALLALLPAGAAAAEPQFGPTAAMTTPRASAAAAALPGGALVAGGFHYLAPQDHEGAALSSAEVYDATTGEFTATGSMALPRMNAVAAPLPNGDVLVAGGHNKEGGPWASAEVYDHESGEFGATGSMAVARRDAAAAVLPDGSVLVLGGAKNFGTGGTSLLSSAEIYDPVSGEFSPTGSMAVGRLSPAATALPDGRILVAGGFGSGEWLSSAEIYDPANGEFSPTGALPAPMTGVGATLEGAVLVFGDLGYQGFGRPWEREIEEYDPVGGSFSASALEAPAWGEFPVATLPDGSLLLAGGSTGAGGFAGIKPEAQVLTTGPLPVVSPKPAATKPLAAAAAGAQSATPSSESAPVVKPRPKRACKRAGSVAKRPKQARCVRVSQGKRLAAARS